MPTYDPLSHYQISWMSLPTFIPIPSESSTSEPAEDFKGFKKTRDFGDFQASSSSLKNYFTVFWEIPALIVTLVLPQVFSDSPRRLEDSPARRWDGTLEKRQDLNPFTFLVKYSLYKCEKLSRQCHRLHNWNWNGDELACLKVSVCRPVSVMMCKKSFSELWNVFLSKF